ncbi:hypothetical protein [Streptomyces bathyalis]|uniref:hypothetical protein n=1 Tax=Streptomyces bathyalis TaxID=2710756 RepID=UPI0018D191F2|nr:hypothetical protein [Streptomyces bathyalis]
MNGEPPGEPAAGPEPGEAAEDEHALRRKQLLAKVREANRRSVSGPDSPALGRPR